MLREPMDWLISRYKYALKMNRDIHVPVSLTDAAMEYGSRYFTFFDMYTRLALQRAFEHLSALRRNGSTQQTFLNFEKDLERVFVKTKALWESSVVILIYSEYDSSVYLMSELLGNPALRSVYEQKYKGIRINAAADSPRLRTIGANQSSPDYLGAKYVLRLHYILYELAVSEFQRELNAMTTK